LVINTATNAVVGSPIAVGDIPFGVAITPDGTKVVVVNAGSNNISVINTANGVVSAPIGGVLLDPFSVAITPDGTKAYVTNIRAGQGTVSVITIA